MVFMCYYLKYHLTIILVVGLVYSFVIVGYHLYPFIKQNLFVDKKNNLIKS